MDVKGEGSTSTRTLRRWHPRRLPLIVGALLTVSGAVAVIANAGVSAAGGAAESRKPIKIDVQAQGTEHCTGKFFLSLGIDGDVGKTECRLTWGSMGKTAEGLSFRKVKQTSTLTGKAGTLVIVSSARAYFMEFGNLDVWNGTWSIVKGTDAYIGLRGGGAFVAAGNATTHIVAANYAGSTTGA